MSYLLAAALGALSVAVAQLILRRKRRAAYRTRSGPEHSFRRYVGLIVPDQRGTTEIDEILVTPAGVFVVEAKDYAAWIFGNADDDSWTAVYPNSDRHRFQNPIRQNYRHIRALESFLRTRRSVFSSIVAFSPRATFMTALPPQVLTSDHVDFVRRQDGVVLTPEEFDNICAQLDTMKATSDTASFEKHVNHLHERFESTTQCPRCAGHLVRRQSKKPGYEGSVFLGCSNYPTCRYIRNLHDT